jgi:16S rRNA (cytosine967-C5)-methyltransferase
VDVIGAPGQAARQAALEMLSQVLRKRRPLEGTLDTCRNLDERDAGFARAIASQTLRHFGQLDSLIRDFVPKFPAPHRSGITIEILLAGACELLFLDVAPHAAVDGANRLARCDEKAVHFKPLINAVLRRVSREGREAIARQNAPRLNTPDWLWTRWSATYGEEVAYAIAASHENQPPLDLVSRNLVPDGAQRLFGDVWRMRIPRRVEDIPGFEEGAFWVQDAAATLPAHLLGDVKGARVLDLCAAPGGKTAQLARAGANVTAVERNAHRLSRLADNLARLKLEARLVLADIRDLEAEAAPFVLLDAPCSATGTIRRHPDLPWIKDASDVTQCQSSGAELLDCAAAKVAPGGVLVFAVCSLEAEEGPEQIESFLARNAQFRRVAIAPGDVFGHAEFIDATGDLRTLPCHLGEQGGMDGFYAARLRRIS